MQIETLGDRCIPSSKSQTVSDEVRIPEWLGGSEGSGLSFELAGPRAQLYFDRRAVRAGIVTCGGLSPGLNNVIRSVFLELFYGYGVREIFGFRNGYAGLDPNNPDAPVKLGTEFVEGIHRRGGTILGSSRGPVDTKRAVDNLVARGINILFTVGGDGTQRGAMAIYQEARRHGHPLAVVGIPKTIDNDVPFVTSTFGFATAVEESVRVLDCAHTEVISVAGGIGLVKLMGRHAGFITAGATVASQDVNFALIPEVPFRLEAFLNALCHRMRSKSHALIAVAEGAGQNLLDSVHDCDASGNKRLQDIGRFLRTQIEERLISDGVPCIMRYFDPSYQVRSRPANSQDALLCDLFARNAVHAAMAGKTGLIIGRIHDQFIHVPIELLASREKRLDPASAWWCSVLAATGQPPVFV